MNVAATPESGASHRGADIRCQIREFVASTFYAATAAGVTDEASLIEAGIIDSTGVLEVIGFLEATFGFHVDDDEIVPENLDSIDHITTYVLSKCAWS